MLLQEGMELLHELVLLEYLPGDVLGVRVMTVIAMEREGHELGIVIGRVGNAHAEEAPRGIADMARHLPALDCLLLEDVHQRKRLLDAIRKLLGAKLLLCLLVLDEVGARPARSLGRRHVKASEVLSAHLVGNTGKSRQVAITRGVDVHLGLDAHLAAFGEEVYGGYLVIFYIGFDQC